MMCLQIERDKESWREIAAILPKVLSFRPSKFAELPHLDRMTNRIPIASAGH